jgi:hypothetical protein
LIVEALLLVVACSPQTKTQQGGLYGAAGGAVAGAVIGQAIGRDIKATLLGSTIGAAVVGAGGAGVGKMMDNQEREMRQAFAASEAAEVQREGNLLTVALKEDVTCEEGNRQNRRLGGWSGPWESGTSLPLAHVLTCFLYVDFFAPHSTSCRF